MDKQDDDGFILSESRAIARYLEEKYPNQGTQLFPKDFEKRALVDQATWAEASYYSRFGGTLTFEILNKKCVIKALVLLSILIHVFFFKFQRFFSFKSDTTEIENAKRKLFATLDTYEKILSKQKYIAGDVHISAEYLNWKKKRTLTALYRNSPLLISPLCQSAIDSFMKPSYHLPKEGPTLRGGSMSFSVEILGRKWKPSSNTVFRARRLSVVTIVLLSRNIHYDPN